ncbi:hypothetical protein K488DRAFT_28761, partial [Vararia minispora EC-137]
LSDTPLDDFFASYPDFSYNPRASATDEFYRMCDEFGWDSKRNTQKRRKAHQLFKDALVHQFNQTYGTEVNSLRSWQALCEALGLDEIPDTLKDCQEVVEGVYVNIVDFVDAREGGAHAQVKIFDTEVRLSEYTIKTGKYFPKENAYAGGLLRHLLRQI